jgi:ankyrin repeat protein
MEMRMSLFAYVLAGSLSIAAQRNSEGLTPLHQAAAAGNSRRVEVLLKQKADVLALDSKMGTSALHKAVYSGDARTVELLLKAGAPINLQSPSIGNTALHDAVSFRKAGDLSVIETLIKFRPSLAIKNRPGLTALELARVLKAQDAVTLLEKYESDRQSPESRKLMEAVRANKVDDARLLVTDHKSILSEADEQGFTPLIWAAREGYTDLVTLFLQNGADPNQNDQWMVANAGHKAAFWGRAEVLKILVKNGLNLEARGGYNGYTALHDAVSGHHDEAAEVLFRAGARVDVKGHDGKTALSLARANGNKKLIALFSARRP